MTKHKQHKGSSVDKFLEEEGLLDDVEAVAIKRVIVYQLQNLMKKNDLNKSEIAEKLGTSRSALDRLLDPTNTSVTLNTLIKAAQLVGKRLKITFS